MAIDSSERMQLFLVALHAAESVLKFPSADRFECSRPDIVDDETGGTPVSRARKAFRLLEEYAPLERDIDSGVWESLSFEPAKYRARITIANVIGEREHVTSINGPYDHQAAMHFDEWCRCREQSEDLGTPWDVARRERRLGWRQFPTGGGRSLIDRGANFAIDLLASVGCQSQYSCEGHPNGAYVTFDGPTRDEAAAEFKRLGWRVEKTHDKRTVARMPDVKNVRMRDRIWRELAAEFRADFGLPGMRA